MILVDANVLLYSINSDEPHHRAAHAWLDRALSGTETVGFCWTVLLAFLRIATAPQVFPSPLDIDRAVEVAGAWLGQPAAMTVEPTARHLPILHSLLETTGSAANLVNDAHLAALALEHRAAIATFDRDFDRFEGIRRISPPAG
jgi:toxin-antitoxin system PIN domain toxin